MSLERIVEMKRYRFRPKMLSSCILAICLTVGAEIAFAQERPPVTPDQAEAAYWQAQDQAAVHANFMLQANLGAQLRKASAQAQAEGEYWKKYAAGASQLQNEVSNLQAANAGKPKMCPVPNAIDRK